MYFASRTGDPRVIATVARYVVIADWLFTTPTIVLQPLTGFWLMHLAGLTLEPLWLRASIALYLLAGACWLPVVWMQIRMRTLAADAVALGGRLPDKYHRFLRWWVTLGVVAFLSLVVVFYLMVAKPA
jgi:uncharacterized membrane protein